MECEKESGIINTSPCDNCPCRTCPHRIKPVDTYPPYNPYYPPYYPYYPVPYYPPYYVGDPPIWVYPTITISYKTSNISGD